MTTACCRCSYKFSVKGALDENDLALAQLGYCELVGYHNSNQLYIINSEEIKSSLRRCLIDLELYDLMWKMLGLHNSYCMLMSETTQQLSVAS
ncbi:hypothetical protein Mapa_007106 [Marchantia paleacea]|nr:hypothetical protein Mapa_007106 [Marchantia paleacea]